jgi:rRNA-processing protein FCF1
MGWKMLNKVAVDSNALSYLVDAVFSPSEPPKEIQEEKISLFRSYVYLENMFYVMPTVKTEFLKIKENSKLAKHISTSGIMLRELETKQINKVNRVAEFYSGFHKGEKNFSDCKILAECEILGMDILLSYDEDFVERLKNKSMKVSLMFPSEFWKVSGVPSGSEIRKQPLESNPMSKSTWWRW